MHNNYFDYLLKTYNDSDNLHPQIKNSVKLVLNDLLMKQGLDADQRQKFFNNVL
jgi:hypothetical protein